MSLRSFPRFLELPKELQIQIWSFAAVNAETGIYTLADYWSPDEHGHPILEGPYSGRRFPIYRESFLSGPASGYRRSYVCHVRPILRLRPIFRIMNHCRFFRLLGLAYWHRQLQSFMKRWCSTAERRLGLRKKVTDMLGVLEECIEQINHGIRADAVRARM